MKLSDTAIASAREELVRDLVSPRWWVDRYGMGLLDAIDALKKEMDLTYCAYCGESFPMDDDATKVSAHIATCPKHPMRDVEAERDALKAEVFRWVKDRLPETEDGALLLAKSDRVRPCVVSRQGVIEQWQSLFSAWCRIPADEEPGDE